MSIIAFITEATGEMQALETLGGNLLCKIEDFVAYCNKEGKVLRYSDEYEWDRAIDSWGREVVTMPAFEQMMYRFEFEHNVHELEYEEDRKLILPFLYSQIGSEGYLKADANIKPHSMKTKGINVCNIHLSEIRTFSAYGFEWH